MKNYEELQFEITFFTEDVVTASQLGADNDVDADDIGIVW